MSRAEFIPDLVDRFGNTIGWRLDGYPQAWVSANYSGGWLAVVWCPDMENRELHRVFDTLGEALAACRESASVWFPAAACGGGAR